MTSSMQLAQECLQQEDGSDNTRPPPEGLELFATTIDSSKKIASNLMDD